MRAILFLVLLVAPWSGCIDVGPARSLTLFAIPAIERGDAAPVPLASCADLLDTLNERALTHARVQLDLSVTRAYGPVGFGGDFAVAEDAPAPGAPQAASAPKSARDAQVTGTNNQETAADEADLIKTDGEWTYVFAQGVLEILHSENVGDIARYARMEFPSTWGGEILLERRDPEDPDDDRLVLVLRGSLPEAAKASGMSIDPYRGGMTQILVLSLKDRAKPFIEKEFWIEGDSAGARLVDGTAYVVVHRWEQDLGLRTWAEPQETELQSLGISSNEYYRLGPGFQEEVRRSVALDADHANRERLAELRLSDHLPVILRGAAGRVAQEPIDEPVCSRVLTTPGSTGRGVSTILALGVDQPALLSSTTQILGGRPIVYASGDDLVLAAASQDFWWFWAQPDLEEATDLQWFGLDGLKVSLRASGRVAGIVQDSFGVDVEGDELRVATTTGTWGRWWLEDPAPMMNHVAVFEARGGQLVPRGMVGGIAPEERIWSARFTADRAYLVTFRQMDPLWVIDLSGPPKILGELEIPGVSTYIHPLSDDALLTIGLGPGPGGQGLDWSRLQVSLFDISDPKKPVRADALYVSPRGGYSWSGAIHEHKAFTYWDAVGTLAVPVATQRSYETMDGTGRTWMSDYHVGLRLVSVDTEAMDLSLRGEVDQDHLLGEAQNWGAEIQRSYFLGYPDTGPVSVYAISQLGVTAHDLDTLKPQDFVAFGQS